MRQVDLVIVGTDRVTANGDVANKIGTYLKALAAHRQRRAVLRRAAALDHRLDAGRRLQDPDRGALGRRGAEDDRPAAPTATSPPSRSPRPARRAANPAFDVTPARLVTGLITERGVTPATREGLLELYPERRGG